MFDFLFRNFKTYSYLTSEFHLSIFLIKNKTQHNVDSFHPSTYPIYDQKIFSNLYKLAFVYVKYPLKTFLKNHNMY